MTFTRSFDGSFHFEFIQYFILKLEIIFKVFASSVNRI